MSMDHVRPMCIHCKHFHRDADDLTCDAFPDGIPDKIFGNDAPHDRPFEGDNGIRFKQSEDMPDYWEEVGNQVFGRAKEL